MFYAFDGKVPAVGRRTYVSELASVIGNVDIGDDCYVGPGAILRGDHGRIEIGDGSAVEEGVVIHAAPGHIQRIGRKVTLGHGAMVHARTIGDGAVVGMGAVVSIESEIGEGAIVAEGSVVKWGQRIDAGLMAAGNPARALRAVSDKDRLIWDYGKQLYIDLAHKYLEEGMHPVEPVRKP